MYIITKTRVSGVVLFGLVVADWVLTANGSEKKTIHLKATITTLNIEGSGILLFRPRRNAAQLIKKSLKT